MSASEQMDLVNSQCTLARVREGVNHLHCLTPGNIETELFSVPPWGGDANMLL